MKKFVVLVALSACVLAVSAEETEKKSHLHRLVGGIGKVADKQADVVKRVAAGIETRVDRLTTPDGKQHHLPSSVVRGTAGLVRGIAHEATNAVGTGGRAGAEFAKNSAGVIAQKAKESRERLSRVRSSKNLSSAKAEAEEISLIATEE